MQRKLDAAAGGADIGLFAAAQADGDGAAGGFDFQSRALQLLQVDGARGAFRLNARGRSQGLGMNAAAGGVHRERIGAQAAGLDAA